MSSTLLAITAHTLRPMVAAWIFRWKGGSQKAGRKSSEMFGKGIRNTKTEMHLFTYLFIHLSGMVIVMQHIGDVT